MVLLVTPVMQVINYSSFLEERNYFEESFKAFEKGIAAFNFPYSKVSQMRSLTCIPIVSLRISPRILIVAVQDLWSIYLEKFTKRYGGAKLERARDLFEQVLEKCPAENAKVQLE